MFVVGDVQVAVPAWVVDFATFRRWLDSVEFPEQGKVCFFNSGVWVDLSMEEFFSHNCVRAELGRVLANLMKETKYGRFVPEGMRYVHPETELATEPDGMVVSHEALRSGRVTLVGGAKGDHTQLHGSPEILIEIVSKSSEVKDTEWCMSAYYDAGIEEYRVIDARDADEIGFDVFRRARSGFAATRKSAGWVKSAVLGKSFWLVRGEDADGNPEFTVGVR